MLPQPNVDDIPAPLPNTSGCFSVKYKDINPPREEPMVHVFSGPVLTR
jgi:hypothetical protein